MKYVLSAQVWKDNVLHETEILRFNDESLEMLCRYSSENRVVLGPFDVANVPGFQLMIRKVEGDAGDIVGT